MAHFEAIGSLFIFNPHVLGSTPVAPNGVCAGQRPMPALLICLNRH
jgi:hypothetical protein